MRANRLVLHKLAINHRRRYRILARVDDTTTDFGEEL